MTRVATPIACFVLAAIILRVTAWRGTFERLFGRSIRRSYEVQMRLPGAKLSERQLFAAARAGLIVFAFLLIVAGGLGLAFGTGASGAAR